MILLRTKLYEQERKNLNTLMFDHLPCLLLKHALYHRIKLMVNEGYNATMKEIDLVRMADVSTMVNI